MAQSKRYDSRGTELRFAFGCGSKNRDPNGNPGKWKHGPWTKTCGLPLLYNFEPHPFLGGLLPSKPKPPEPDPLIPKSFLRLFHLRIPPEKGVVSNGSRERFCQAPEIGEDKPPHLRFAFFLELLFAFLRKGKPPELPEFGGRCIRNSSPHTTRFSCLSGFGLVGKHILVVESLDPFWPIQSGGR